MLNFRNSLRKNLKNFIPNLTNLYEGEHHLPFANFAGPGTKLEIRLPRGDEGTTLCDQDSKQHDIDYLNIAKLKKSGLPEQDVDKMVRKSDNKLLEKCDKSVKKDKSLLNKLHHKLINLGINSKKIAEDLGILSKSHFVGGMLNKKEKNIIRVFFEDKDSEKIIKKMLLRRIRIR